MICQTYVQLECDAPDTDDFSGAIVSHRLPGLDLSAVRSRAQRVMRTPRGIGRSSDDHIIVSLQTQGRAVISQDGRDAVIAPGDFAIYDSTRPYTLRFDDDFEAILLTLRGDPFCLLVAGLQSLPACGKTELSSMATYHLARIRARIDERLHDPVLTLESVAAEIGMSVGHLHCLFKSVLPLEPPARRLHPRAARFAAQQGLGRRDRVRLELQRRRAFQPCVPRALRCLAARMAAPGRGQRLISGA